VCLLLDRSVRLTVPVRSRSGKVMVILGRAIPG
jgi:hypothetical protein